MTDKAEETFRARAIKTIDRSNEIVNMRLDGLTAATTANAEAIAQLGRKIDQLTEAIGAQVQNIGRLERAVTEMVYGINAQRDTVDGLIRLATKLVDQRAS